MDLMDFFNQHETKKVERKVLRAPFPYIGSKKRLTKELNKHIPYRKAYIEPFGGSGALLLSRRPSDLEVFNDKYSGVACFYQCIKDPELLKKLIEWVEQTIHSRENFELYKERFATSRDTLERACYWIYIANYSFGGKLQEFGRSIKPPNGMSGKLINKIPRFATIHERLRKVIIENLSWEHIFEDFDRPEAVFYCDPPYLAVNSARTYSHEMTEEDHIRLIETIRSTQGFVALSGYENGIYDGYSFWDSRIEIGEVQTFKVYAYNERNNREMYKNEKTDHKAKEILWIKK